MLPHLIADTGISDPRPYEHRVVASYITSWIAAIWILPVSTKSTGIQCDQIVVLKYHYAKKDYPEKLRRIRYFE
jgi:hypothetical protein